MTSQSHQFFDVCSPVDGMRTLQQKKTGPTVGRDVVSIDNWQPRSFCVCHVQVYILKRALLSVCVFLFLLHFILNTAFALLNVNGVISAVSYACWWFGTCFIFHDIWDNPSHWLICFKMVKTTNQYVFPSKWPWFWQVNPSRTKRP